MWGIMDTRDEPTRRWRGPLLFLWCERGTGVCSGGEGRGGVGGAALAALSVHGSIISVLTYHWRALASFASRRPPVYSICGS